MYDGLFSEYLNGDNPASRSTVSIELEGVFVVAPERGVLLLFPQDAVADDQHLDLGAHETTEGVLGRANNRLAAHIEARIDENRAAGQRLEAGD